MPVVKIRGKISSELQELDLLHEISNLSINWIPSSTSIRPSAEIMEKKLKKLDQIERLWRSFDDYILHHIFNVPLELRSHSSRNLSNNPYMQGNNNPPVVSNEKLKVASMDISEEIKFVPNEFPYSTSGYHWVLWFGTKYQTVSDEKISEIIQGYLNDMVIKYNLQHRRLNFMEQESSGRIRDDNLCEEFDYDFAWYINPKMTVPEFFHVQVFYNFFVK